MKRKNPQSGPGIIEQVKAMPPGKKRKKIIEIVLRDNPSMRTNTINKLKRLSKEDA